MDELSGLLIVGDFVSAGLATKRDGSVVYPGLNEVKVRVSGLRGAFEMSASAFEVDEYGREHPALVAVLRDPPREGSRIALEVVPRAKGQYVNYDLVQVHRLDDESPDAAIAELHRVSGSAS